MARPLYPTPFKERVSAWPHGSCFSKPSTGRRVLVHGDDFLALGDQEALDELDAILRSAYELKRLGMLGDEDGDDRSAHFNI